MPNKETYRMDIVVDVSDGQAKVELKTLDKVLDNTKKHSDALHKTDATPKVDSKARTELTNTEKVMASAKKRADALGKTKVNPTVSMQDKITSPLKKVESNISRLTRSSHRIVLEGVDRVTNVAKRIVSTLTSPLALVGGGAGAGAAIYFPLQLAGEKEQAQMAFDFMAESAERGKQLMNDMLAFAAQTPYEFDFLRETTSGLMGVYKDMFPDVEARISQAKRTFTAFGDAAGRTGATMDQVKLSMLGFKQIAMIGTLSMEELRQVTENLGVPMSIILKELGLANEDLKELGSLGIPASRAMEAILQAFEKNYGGGMEELSRSYFGMTSTLKDTAKLVVTSFGDGMAGPVKDIMSDLIGEFDYTTDKYKAFQGKVESYGSRVGESFKRMYESGKAWFGRLNEDETFKSLDIGGKMIYVINSALDSLNVWLDGPGGEQVESMFTKLGSIAGRAWIAGLKGTFSVAMKEAGHGNVFGALAFGGLFSLLGGGLLLKGGWEAGKAVLNAGKNIPKAPVAEPLSVMSESGKAIQIGAAESSTIFSRFAPIGAEAAAATTSAVSKFAKFAGRAAWPVAIGAGALEIVSERSPAEKTAKAVEVGGGLAGAWGGAKIGAAIGTAIAPGIGTAIGGILGGLGGYVGGRKIGGSLVSVKSAEAGEVTAPATASMGNLREMESFQQTTAAATQAMAPVETVMQENVAIMQSFNVNLQGKATEIITRMGSWSDQAWTITGISTSFAANLQSVADNVIANGWSLVGALSNAASRARSFVLPSFSATPAVPHAAGGIFASPHLGLVAEAGPEAVIPLSARLRDRAVGLYEQVGGYLGVQQAPVSAGAGGVNVSLSGVNVSLNMPVAEIDEEALAWSIGWKFVKPIINALENR